MGWRRWCLGVGVAGMAWTGAALANGQRPPECALPFEAGPCDAVEPVWSFNAEAGICAEAVYRGCEGNANRFPTQEACAARCAPPTSVRVVGALSEQYVARCEGGRPTEERLRVWHEVGFTRLEEAPAAALAAHAGKPVVVTGVPAAPPHAGQPPNEHGDCLEPQLRSDWVATAAGVRVWYGGSGAPAALRVAKIEPFTGLGAKLQRESVVVTFHNTLGVALEDVRLQLQADGCYGKPGTVSAEHVAAKVPAGAKVVARFPKVLRDDPGQYGRDHAARGVRLTARGPAGLYFDLDWGLRQAGVEVACPARK